MLKRSLQNLMNLTEFVKTLTLVSLKHLNFLNSPVILTEFSKSTSYFYLYICDMCLCMCICADVYISVVFL